MQGAAQLLELFALNRGAGGGGVAEDDVHVAEAAGGFLGMKKISGAEKAMLEELARAFSD